MGGERIAALAAQGLVLAGPAPPDPPLTPPGTRALALVAPLGGRVWWDILTASPERQGGTPDPVDRWSVRVLDGIAARFGGALCPFAGPPHLLFACWALATGRVWESPVRLLVGPNTGSGSAFAARWRCPTG